MIIEQTAAEQRTSCKLNEPNTETLRVLVTWNRGRATRFFFMAEATDAVLAGDAVVELA